MYKLLNISTVQEYANLFEGRDTLELLEWVFKNFEKIAFTSSFSADDIVVIHLIQQIKKDAKIIFIDTDYHFPETYDLVEKLRNEWELNLEIIKPEITIAEQEKIYGKNLYEINPDKCCEIRKVEPFKRALNDLNVWITGLRRDQSPTRANIKKLELHKLPSGKEILKVNPIANWTRTDIWKYIINNNLPYNPLYDKGYLSIGCKPCTAIVQGEDERAGRWQGKNKLECGLHTFTEKEGG